MVASGATLALSGTSAAANGRFDIVIRYTGDPTYQAAFTQAAARWTQIITADIPDVNASQCGFIDDLLIDASIVSIDGAGGILGQAGPDWVRNGSLLPVHGEHGVRLRRRRRHVQQRHLDGRDPARDGAHPRHRDAVEIPLA